MTDSTVDVAGLKVHVKIWKVPDGVEEVGRIIYNHGWCEQISYYDPTMPMWTKLGYEVIGFDQRGAGLTSTGKAYAVTNEYWVFHDLDFIVKKYSEGYDKKIYMFGHSMGGGICLNYAVKGEHRDRIDGYVALAPLVVVHQTRMPNIVLQKAMGLMARYWPTYRQIVDPEITLCTSSEKWQKYLRERPGHRSEATAEQMNDMFKRGRNLLNPVFVKKFVDKPVLVCIGTADEVNDPKQTEKFFELLTVKDKKLEIYENARHCLFWEEDTIQAKFFEDVEAWLKSHLHGSPVAEQSEVVEEQPEEAAKATQYLEEQQEGAKGAVEESDIRPDA